MKTVEKQTKNMLASKPKWVKIQVKNSYSIFPFHLENWVRVL